MAAGDTETRRSELGFQVLSGLCRAKARHLESDELYLTRVGVGFRRKRDFHLFKSIFIFWDFYFLHTMVCAVALSCL